VDGQVVKLQVWDTAGQERFRTITQTYYKGAMGIILVYDCTEEKSFSNISNWMKQIEQHASKDVAKVLVGNKADKEDKVIDTETGKQLADEYGLEFFETSAKTGQNINELFQHIAHSIIKDKKKSGATGGAARGETVTIGKSDKKEEKKGGCC
jgi:small GTP-binding protein